MGRTVDVTHSEGTATSSPTIVSRKQCFFAALRLIGFLMLHLIMICAALFAIYFFAITGNIKMCIALILPFALSGILCTIAAWHSHTPLLGCTGLPLSERSLIVGWLLAIPFGLFQGVIVILELEDFCARRRAATNYRVGLRQRFSDAFRGDQVWLDKFHCKAVNGAFEGLVTSAVVLHGFLGLGFPKNDPIMWTPDDWDGCLSKKILGAILCISFISVGLCFLELDFAVSPRIRRQMRRSLTYEFFHWLFRIAEIVSRCSLFVTFMTLTMRRVAWWWVPLTLDIFITMFLVDFYGGCEVTILVRLMCAIPCAFANVFRFVDVHYKRRAARRLSNAFEFRNLLETVALPALCFCDSSLLDDAKVFYQKDYIFVWIALVSHPLYWLALWCFRSPQSSHDLFSACEAADIHVVMSLTSEARVGSDLNVFDIDGKTPLMLVVDRRSTAMEGATEAEICRLLIEEGARVDLPIFEDRRLFWRLVHMPMRRRWTALHLAAWRGCFAVVEALVEGERNFGESFMSSAEDYFIDKQGETPLHIAARNGYVEIVHCLLAQWPHWANVRNRKGKTPLDLASAEDLKEILRDVLVSSSETPFLQSNIRSNQAIAKKALASTNWGWVKLPILETFSVERGPCHAPGLSSYVACHGGGTLGKIFVPNASTLPTIDESTILSMVASLANPDQMSSVAVSWDSSRQSLVSHADSPRTAIPSGRLEDLEPIDANGYFFPIWRAVVQELLQLGQQVGSIVFQHPAQECILGVGSFGVVWRAQDRNTGTKFAVKNVQSPSGGGNTLAQREFEMANHVRLQPHPCIVHFYQIHSFPDRGFHMIVMELCSGGDLLKRIRTARLTAAETNSTYEPPSSALRWLGQVFLALEHIHVKMHSMLRDLKPENVVVSEKGSVAKLTDFGFGRFDTESSGEWSFGIPPGSPGYIAPETLLQQQYDCRVDLYSYGVLIWILLTGGVKYDPEPRPPLSVRKSRTDFTAHANDWYHLRQCIQNPQEHEANPLPTNAANLALKLTQRRQADRPMHAEIRQYPMLQEVGLPNACSSKDAVEAWLAAGEDGCSASSSGALARSQSQ